jgi:hypothetical protein
MISLAGSTISALYPWALAALPLAAGLLVYVYRKKGSSSAQVVSSLFLLKNLPRATPGRRRFVPPLQFWIELSLFLFLGCAAATLILSESGKQIAIVVDTSLSMAATDSANTTSLTYAKSAASADISQMFSPARFSVFSANSTLAAITERGVSSASAVAALPSIEASFASDRLASHIESLLQQNLYDSIWVYTDRRNESNGILTKVKITTTPRTEAEPLNFWVVGLATKAIDGQTFVLATTNLSAHSATRLSLSGTCYAASRVVTLPPVVITQRPYAAVTTKLGPLNEDWSYCRITATSVDNDRPDQLPTDNIGWITRASSTTNITLESDLSAQELGLSNLKGFSFTNSSTTQGSTPLLFHRRLPRLLSTSKLNAPTLLVAPQSGSLPWGGRADDLTPEKMLEVTRWEASHPLLKYVKPTLLQIPATKKLTCPESSSPVLFAGPGPLVCAGEKDGSRYAIVGFELFPFDGTRSPTVSIFTLNLLSWLFSGADWNSGNRQPGELPVSADTSSARYVAPEEETPKLSVSQQLTIQAPIPGVIEVLRGGTPELIAINISSEDESMLSRMAPLSIPTSTAVPKTSAKRDPLNLSSWLTLIALAIACADILRRTLRKQRWTN